MVGKKFGELTVLELAEHDSQGRPQWRCLCTCGVVKIVRADYLKRSKNPSCGCWAKKSQARAAGRRGSERMRARMAKASLHHTSSNITEEGTYALIKKLAGKS
jgi:hypothetical protein